MGLFGLINFLAEEQDKEDKEKEDERRKYLEEQMDLYDLDEEERRAVLSGEYEPEHFDFPGDSSLDEEDFYSEDDFI